MIQTRKIVLNFTVLFGVTLASLISAADTQSETLNVNWPQFMARHDLHWTALPQSWHEAPFIGNGLMGSMIFQLDDNHLVIQLGRTDVQDHRTQADKFATTNLLINQGRLPIGYFTLDTSAKMIGCNLRLNLWDAQISGSVLTESGAIQITALMHSEKMLLIVKAVSDHGTAFDFTWHPEEAFSPRITACRKGGRKYAEDYVPNPAPVLTQEGSLNLCLHNLLAGGQTATAWSVRNPAPNTRILFASVDHSFPRTTARQNAAAVVRAALNDDFNHLLASHRIWWHEFYPRSFISLPDARMESFLWIQHYKMACAARGRYAIADNQGPWLQPTGWPALWWNLNVQLAYSHLLPANHPEISRGLLDRVVAAQKTLARNVPESFRDDSIAINTVSGQDLISPIGNPLDPRQSHGLSTGNMTWVMHNCYMQYRYTMDKTMLREQIFPLLKKAINYYRHFLIEAPDGKIHLPRTASPEYGDAADCNYDLSLLRWGCQTLIDICRTLDISDPLLPRWKDILARLTDYPRDETGLMIGKDKPYAKSHRHYSHLLMIYPLAIMDLDDPAQRALAQKSLLYWQSKPEALAGYSYTGASSMFSLLGNGRMAEQRLQDFFADKILPNTFYAEGSPVIESPLAAARSIEDMLIQSATDTIKVFPAVPDKWRDIAVADLRTEGAFLVSALRQNGKNAFVSIKSLAGAPCRIDTGIKAPTLLIGIESSCVKTLSPGRFELDIPQNAHVIIADKDYRGDFSITPVTPQYHTDWQWGKPNQKTR